MPKIRMKLIAAVLSITLLGSISMLPSISQADEDSEQEKQVQTVQNNLASVTEEIAFQGESTVKIDNMYLIPNDEEQVLYMSLEVSNHSSAELDFYPYWLKVRSKSGSSFAVRVLGEHENNIQPGDKETFAYYAIVPRNIEVQDLELSLIKWDFSMPDYQSVIHNFELPQELPLPIAQGGSGQIIQTDRDSLEGQLSSVQVYSSGESKTVDVTLVMTNTGRSTLELPHLEYTLRDEAGYVYPLVEKDSDADTIHPRLSKEIKLSAEVPADMKLEDYKLLISDIKEEVSKPFPLPLLGFTLDTGASEPSEQGRIGEPQLVAINGNHYELTLSQLYKNPSLTSAQKIVTFQVNIKNPSKDRLPVPELGGYAQYSGEEYFVLDAIEVERNSLMPGQETQTYMWVEIPEELDSYTDSLAISITGDTGEQQRLSSPVITFDVNQTNIVTHDLSYINIYDPNGEEGDYATVPDDVIEFEIETPGKKSTVTVGDMSLFEGSGTNIIATNLRVTNEDTRPMRIPELKGYFLANDGSIYPAEFKGREQSILPKGAADVIYWAELSQGVDIENLRLVLGEPLEGDSELFTNTVALEFDGDGSVEVNEDPYEQRDTFEYSINSLDISIGRLRVRDPDFEARRATIELEYSQEMEANVIDDGYSRKFTFEFQDSRGSILQSETYQIGNHDSDFSEGKNYIPFSYEDSRNGIMGITMHVYEHFESGKRLIAVFKVNFY